MTQTSPAYDVAQYLVSSAGGSIGVIGTDLFVFAEPDSPDACWTILDSGGMDPDVHGNERPTIQVRYRAQKGQHKSAYDKVREVVDALHASHGWTEGSTYYQAVFLQGDVMHLGPDDKDRPVVVANFRLMRRAT